MNRSPGPHASPALLRGDLDALPDPLPIPVLSEPFNVTVRPPGSKSLTNRALLLGALADGKSVLRDPLTKAEDARVMIEALTTLGAEIRGDESSLRIRGVGGRWRVPSAGVTLNLQNAGTGTRFLAAAAVLGDPRRGAITIDGNARMRQRPIGDLVALLRAMGVTVEELGSPGHPPIAVRPCADSGKLAPELLIGGTASSQFISALMLIAPFLARGLHLRFTEPVTSASYVRMTEGLLERLGARVERDADGRAVRVSGPLSPFEYHVEPDASGATYFWGAAALVTGSTLRVPGLVDSLQPDARFLEILASMGASTDAHTGTIRSNSPLRAISTDMSLMPDAALTVGALACFAKGTTRMTGLGTLRVKETDRIAAMRTEFTRLGVAVKAGDDWLEITPPGPGIDIGAAAPRIEFDTYDDHRMAMSLSLVGLRRPNVFIRDPRCVAKTYAEYWRHLATLFTP